MINRELEFEITQNYRELQVGGEHYKLVILEKNDRLIYARLSSQDTVLAERKEYQNLSAQLKQRAEIYQNELDLEDSYDFPNDVFIYGSFCGISGSPPQQCKKMLDLVNQDNYSQLADWLRSMNPEISAYGYTGLQFLELKGGTIQEPEKLIMQHVAVLDLKLNTCAGCFIYNQIPMREALSAKRLRKQYKGFKKSGWLY